MSLYCMWHFACPLQALMIHSQCFNTTTNRRASTCFNLPLYRPVLMTSLSSDRSNVTLFSYFSCVLLYMINHKCMIGLITSCIRHRKQPRLAFGVSYLWWCGISDREILTVSAGELLFLCPAILH